ncbi:protein PHYLLO, chloroplastic isoform X5 [Citrus sinensis]|uniref:protein PHYLLO, chloroplastic isoform X5 n=1 Tax=Citrus sinensis TaxID=2711 RepID=UPI00227858D4|nr:protein PHYLLO, chloroplastic isoform X5 [Citrus sinensis]
MDPFTLAVKAHHVHFTNSFSTESSISKHRLTKSLGIPKPSPPLTFLTRISGFRHFNSIDLLRNSGSKVVEGLRFDGPVMDVDEIMDCEEGDLVVETSITRTLPPALTLEHGLESISEAVNKLKTDPPSSSSGVLRFQNRGVFGIGAAVYFTHPAWCDSEERTKPKRYLSTNPIPITTYGFMDINFNTEPSCIKHEAGSFYFFVPQIELRELDDISILAATLAWSNGMVCTFEQAIQSFESSFCQVSSHFCSSTERYNPRYVRSALTKFNMMEDKTVQMVCMNAITLGRRDFGCDFMEMREAPFSFQFSFRFSPTLGVANNMQLDNAIGMNYSLGDHVNINAVWASLLIEECSRLGLTYFCIAPGSRSSPLAVAASTHPLITCIACYDERSLAFHALGYARGSHRPAVIITSSGTAVSNLLPAVVEASQDFVPVLLLTADRPPELQDAGANQAINQVNHFGSFVRFFFSLPAPTDQIPARMILTTLDAAVHWATSSPYGPVHINCPFREPLDNSPKHWMSSCLKGLDIWTSSIEPFTKYIQVQHSHACKSYTYGQMAEVLELVQGVNKGLLLVGAVHNEDEIWAVLHLARHIRWPVVADILSGLRLRKLLASFLETEQNILFLDHLDHALLSESVKDWIQFDVIIQIGSRITSKRISQMIEECFPCTYILVDNHPCRHDPSHSVTHRIQSTIVQFVDFLLKVQVPHRSSKWCSFLRALDMMVASEISFQICTDYSLTEPHVAHELSRALTSNSALFVGNSMAIRDVDMYGRNWTTCTRTVADIMLNSEFPQQWIRVAGNRGASGIDGLLSTAIGFAVGCNKHVLCVVGDISFLHDTNGLAILKQRMKRKPILMLVMNNHGGAIFSLLPIADRTEPRILDQYFYTTHNISIQNLCLAHGLNHVQVKTKVELEEALSMSQHLGTDRVIEVESCIDANATFHSMLRKFARQSADHTLNVLSQFSVPDTISCSLSICKICRMEYSLYRIQLCALPTSSYIDHNRSRFCREGFILSLYLEDGSVGYGEVAPLEIHKENLLDAEEQLRFLLHFMTGAKISYFLPLLKGSFSSWIWSTLGIPACEIFPSVRCGLEMAILNAIAVKHGSSFLNILYPLTEIDEEISKRSTSIKICALIDSNKSPVEVASIATTLVEEGFTAIKLKVARRADPIKDAEVIQEVRKKVGHRIELRVDANRNWTYQEALEFGFLVKDCDLQYIEEPVQNEEDIIKYCEESGLPVALDETIDKFQKDPLNMLEKYAHPGIVAIVIKPSVIGGFENAGLIARWAQRHGKMAVVSAAFESGLGLSAYIIFSSYLELQNAYLCKVMNRELCPPVAQGLGTYQWLKEDITTDPISICHNSCSGFVEASVAKATHILQNLQINNDVICKTSMEEQVLRYQLNVNSKDFCSFIKVQEIGQRIDIQDNILLFLHGFLGTGEEWIPIMKAVSGSARCISIDLPGHGGSKMQNHVAKATQEITTKATQEITTKATQEITLSIDVIADVLYKLIEQITPGKVTLVGYSMGARIALYMALRFSDKIKGTVIISGSPGLRDNIARKIRRAEDDSRACALVTHGLQVFLDTWYTGELWESLRSHPHFNRIVASRLLHEDVQSLSKALSDLSVGRQPPLWEDLKLCSTPLLIVVGEKDKKFKSIAEKMCYELSHDEKGSDDLRNQIYEMVEIPNCGHAVHLENPLPVIRAVRQFLTRVNQNSTSNPESNG